MSISKKWLQEKDQFWSKNATEKGGYTPPEGTFAKSGKEVADQLLKDSKDAAQAMQRLMFYINRSGKSIKPEQMTELNKAKDLIHDKTAAAKKEESKEKK